MSIQKNTIEMFGEKDIHSITQEKGTDKGGGLKQNSGKESMSMDKLVEQTGNEENWGSAVL